MKQFLLPHLICPACLPAEISLDPKVKRREGDDIVSGELACRKCRRTFPIKDGIAFLLPEPDSYVGGGQLRYDDNEMLNRYLWSHYADLAGSAETVAAQAAWVDCLAGTSERSFEAGCSVGRLTFEAASRSELAVGCDLSLSFIRAARRLAQERRATFSLPLEGKLRETFTFEIPDTWRSDNLEFVVANAQAIPFAQGTFQQIVSLNLLDRVNYPLAHLYEMNRIARQRGASFLLADPFSWSTASAPEERWLGGTINGAYQGRGIDNVRSLLTGKDKILLPPWRISREGSISWLMRSHRNHRELITSDYLLAQR